jgi:hypothetical protein
MDLQEVIGCVSSILRARQKMVLGFHRLVIDLKERIIVQYYHRIRYTRGCM